MLSPSVAGMSIDGGRFNRSGVEALYLSRSAQTALEEYKQGSSITASPWKLADLVITAGFSAEREKVVVMPPHSCSVTGH